MHDLLADTARVQDNFNLEGGAERKVDDLSVYDLRHVRYFPNSDLLEARLIEQISPLGHRRMGELVNAYIGWQLCELTHMGFGSAEDENDLDPLPRVHAYLSCTSYHELTRIANAHAEV